MYGVWLQWRPLDLTFWFSALGLYGKFHTRCLAEIPKDALFLDIGANQGLFASWVQRRGNRVIAFEPNPLRFADLAANLKLNGSHSAVALCAAVTGVKPDLLALHIPRFHSGAASLVKHQDCQSVTALSLGQEFFDHLACEHTGPIWVKIDVEGAEEQVLNALSGSKLSRQIDGIIIECSKRHHDNSSLTSVDSILTHMGLKETRRHGIGQHEDRFFKRPIPGAVTQSQSNCHLNAI